MYMLSFGTPCTTCIQELYLVLHRKTNIETTLMPFFWVPFLEPQTATTTPFPHTHHLTSFSMSCQSGLTPRDNHCLITHMARCRCTRGHDGSPYWPETKVVSLRIRWNVFNESKVQSLTNYQEGCCEELNNKGVFNDTHDQVLVHTRTRGVPY